MKDLDHVCSITHCWNFSSFEKQDTIYFFNVKGSVFFIQSALLRAEVVDLLVLGCDGSVIFGTQAGD